MADALVTAPTPPPVQDGEADPFDNVSPLINGDEGVDMQALAQFSDIQTQRAKAAQQKQETRKNITAAEALEQDPEQEDEGGDPREEDSEEGDQAEDEDEESGEEEDSEEEGDDLDLLGEDEKLDGRRYVVAKTDDKSYRLPKNAKLTVTVDGEDKELPVQEVIRLASGAQYIEQKSSELGRREVKVKELEYRAHSQYQEFRDNLQLIYDAAKTGSVEDVVSLFGEMTGQEPGKVIENLIGGALQYAERLSGLTDRERQLENENRRYRFQQRMSELKRARESQNASLAQERAQVEQRLKANGLNWNDWNEAANDLAQRLQAGENLPAPSANSIADHALRRAHEAKVKKAITSVSTKLEGKKDLYDNISQAVIRAEALIGAPLSVPEVARLVVAAKQKYNASLNGRLSKKAARAKKAGAPKTESAKPQQVDKNKTITLREHREALYGS